MNEPTMTITISIIGRNYDSYDMKEKEEICEVPLTMGNEFEQEKIAYFKAGLYVVDSGLIEIYNELTDETIYIHYCDINGETTLLHSIKEVKKHLKKFDMSLEQ